MKRLTVLLSLMVILVMVAACMPAAAPMAEPSKTFKIGLLTIGPVQDQGWNQTAYDGMVFIQKDLGAEMSYVELGESPADFEKAFRDYGSKGYNMVLAHGFQFQDAAIDAAKEFPNTFFFISNSFYWNPKTPNVIGINPSNSELYYVLGYIAGKMGKAGGYIGGVQIPTTLGGEIGFRTGAQAARPDFLVLTTYIDSWTDIATAKDAATGMIGEGVDFVVPNANIAGNGVYQAAVEHNAWAFGTFGDQTQQAPKNIIASFSMHYGQGLVNIARQIQAGTYKPTGNIILGLKDPGVFTFIFNDRADLKLPQDAREGANRVIDDIKNRKIDTDPGQTNRR